VANHLWQDKLLQRSVSAGKCTTLMNHPDATLFRAIARQRAGTERFVMLYHGTLNRHQGLDIAVDAFSKLACRLPTVEFHIYGEGPARAGLVEQVTRLGLNGRVKLFNSVPLSEIARVVALADLGVVPKRADGFGNEAFSTKVLEFMACRVPVIVARTKVDDHYFSDRVVRFFEPGNAHDLATQMRWALEHPAELEGVASAGQVYALEHSWERSAGSYLAIVDELDGLRRLRASPKGSAPS
jgi:glycosyltransferase involved in cell wall biosynthesis